MILKTSNNGTDLTIGDLETSSYQIQASGKMFEILSSKLYTDKIMAPIRELICNAYDAHKMVGNESKPIVVHIPSNSCREFAVMDFGPGLSMEEMRNLYTTYGASNKSNSNDFIGCLGLGSKSPFAYTDTFTVTSRHKGRKFLFCCSMSGGCPNITGMEAESDKQQDGLEVRFTVSMGDFFTFEKSVERFAEFFCAPIETIKDGVHNTLNPREVDWGKYDVAVLQDVQVGEIGVVMGGVLYSCNVPSHSSVSPLTREQYEVVRDAVRCLGYKKRFVIKAPLGAVDIAASREHCEMTARTSSFVMTKLYDFISAVENDMLATLRAKKLPTLKFFCEWDAALRNFEFLSNNNLDKAVGNFLSTTGLCVHANDPTSTPILDTVLHVAVSKPSNQRRRAFYTHFDNEAHFKTLNGSLLRFLGRISTVTALCSDRVLVIDVSAKKKAKFVLPTDVHDIYQRVTDFFLIDDHKQCEHLKSLGMAVVAYNEIPWPVHERTYATGTRTRRAAERDKVDNPFAALQGWRSPRVTGAAWWNTDARAYINAHSAFGKAELDPAVIERVSEAIKNDRLILLPSTSRNQDSVALSPDWIENVMTELGYDLQQNGDHLFLSDVCSWLVGAMRAYGYEPIFGCFVKADVKTLNEKISKVAKALNISEPKQLIKKLFVEASSKQNKVATTDVWNYIIFRQKFNAVFQTKDAQELFDLCSNSLSKEDRRFLERASKPDVDCDASYKGWLTTILTYKDLRTVSEYAYNWYPSTKEFEDFTTKIEAIDEQLKEAWPLILKMSRGRYESFFSNIRRLDSYCTPEEFAAVIEMVKAVVAFRKKNK